MFKLAGFGDEISPELSEQTATLSELGLRWLELRGVWGKNVLELGSDEAARLRGGLEEAGIRVSALATPIGKTRIEESFAPELDRLHRALALAKELNVRYLRLFSFYVPEGKEDSFRPEVVRRVTAFAGLAAEAGAVLLLENEKGLYGASPARVGDLLTEISSPYVRMTFDPANFVQAGFAPLDDCYESLREFIEYVHIKDARRTTGQVFPAGEGDGQLRRLLEALLRDEYTGFLSLEPHLATAGPTGGTSGPQLFARAAKALQGILSELGAPWE